MKKINMLIGTALIVMGLCACGNNENLKSTEIESKELVEEVVEHKTLTEETVSEEETTTEEEIRIPVDERYEYLLYAEKDIEERRGDEIIEPIIGFNIPEGWENVGEGRIDQYYTDVSMQPDASDRGTLEITTSESEYESYFITGEIFRCKQMEFDEKESVETPFGIAQIYYCKLAVDISDRDYQDPWMEEYFQSMVQDGTGFEEDGKRYTTEELEVALITIANNHIMLKTYVADNAGYQSVLKEDIVQIFKLD